MQIILKKIRFWRFLTGVNLLKFCISELRIFPPFFRIFFYRDPFSVSRNTEIRSFITLAPGRGFLGMNKFGKRTLHITYIAKPIPSCVFFQKRPHWVNFTNTVQGMNFKKLGHFIKNNILANDQKRSSFLELTPCAELVNLSHSVWRECKNCKQQLTHVVSLLN